MHKNHKVALILTLLIISTLACSLPLLNPSTANENQAGNEIIIDGRSSVSNQGDIQVEITVPESYVLGNSGSDLAPFVGDLQTELGQDAEKLQQLFQNYQADILFWGYEPGSQGIPPVSFVVLKNDQYALMPLGLIGTVAGVMFGEDVNIVQQDRLNLGGRDTLRLFMTSDSLGSQSYQVAYFFKDEGKLFIVVFIADQSTVESQSGFFNSIVSSLNVVAK